MAGIGVRTAARCAGPVAAALILFVSMRSGGASGAQPPAGPVTISIVGTNDLHGGILPRDGRGGLALLSAYVKNLRAVRVRDGGAVLLIDAGDMFQGTLESNLMEGASVVAAYNTLGYTAAAIGNHEFDFGPAGPAATPAGPADDPRGALKARAAEAKFPLLAANLIDRGTGRPVEWPNVRPSVIVEAAGVAVGIVGAMTFEALGATISANVGGLEVVPLAPAIAAEASRLRAGGARLVVLTAHAGGRCGNLQQSSDVSSCDPASEIVRVARALPRGAVDVIVAGHTHAGMAHLIEDTAVIEAFALGRAFGRVDVVVDRSTGKVSEKRIFPPRDLCAREDPKTGDCDTNPIPAPSSVVASYEGAAVVSDPAIARVIAPALEAARELKARPIGIFLESSVRRQRGGHSPLGNLFTDALRESVPGADLSLHNVTGGLRADLPQGPLVYGSVYEVMPFDNKVVSLELTGAQVKAIFANHFQTTRRTLGVSGIRVRAQCAEGKLAVTLLDSSGRDVKDEDRLTVVLSDFLATGGDGILKPVIPPQGFVLPDNAPLARDVLAGYLGRRGGQLREEALLDLANPRIVVAGELPAVCAR
jgi:5'-nucleotidase